MPLNTKLTGTPKPVLTDPANVETTIAPGFDTLEKFVVPRFASVSARNTAFSGETISLGQMCFVTSDGSKGFYVWNGSSWEEFGRFAGLRPLANVATSDQTTSSSVHSDYTKMDVTLRASRKYRYIAHLSYRNSDSSSIMHVTWKSQTGLQASMSMVAGTNLVNNFTTDYLFRDTDPISSTPDGFSIGVTSSSTPLPVILMGHVIVGSTDTLFRLQIKKTSGSGSVTLTAGTWIEFTEY